MSTSISENNTKLLNEDDVVTLFGKLEDKMGNRKEAAKRCRITRKAVYDWARLTHPMKNSTKKKVLDQLLEYLPEETLGYLTKRTLESCLEALMSYVAFLYESIHKTKEPSEAIRQAEKFEVIKKVYAGLIYNRHEYEIDDLSSKIEQYIQSIGEEWHSSRYYLYDSISLKDIITEVLRTALFGKPEDDEELAIRLKIPTQVISGARSMVDEASVQRPFKQTRFTAEGRLSQMGGTIETSGSAPAALIFQFATEYKPREDESNRILQTAASLPVVRKSES